MAPSIVVGQGGLNRCPCHALEPTVQRSARTKTTASACAAQPCLLFARQHSYAPALALGSGQIEPRGIESHTYSPRTRPISARYVENPNRDRVTALCLHAGHLGPTQCPQPKPAAKFCLNARYPQICTTTTMAEVPPVPVTYRERLAQFRILDEKRCELIEVRRLITRGCKSGAAGRSLTP